MTRPVLFRALRFFSLLSICSIFSLPLLSANDTTEDTWVIAASVFDSNIESDETATLIPQYILQSIPPTVERTVLQQEQFRHAKRQKSEELQEMYETLQQRIFERDSLVLSYSSDIDYEKNLLEKEEEIVKLKEEIEEKKIAESALSVNDFEPIEKAIIPWQTDASKLYDVPDTMKFFNPKDIDGLLTGSITHQGNFLQVNLTLRLFPGNVIALELSEIDSTTSIEELSKRLSKELYLHMTNKERVALHFSIEPKSAVEQSTIYINGITLKPNGQTLDFESIDLTSGIYEFYVESQGYEGISATYLFANQDDFDVTVHLKERSATPVDVVIPMTNGSMYINTKKMLSQKESISPQETTTANEETENRSEEESEDTSEDTIENFIQNQELSQTEGTVYIDNFPALGEFVSSDGIATWFIIDTEQQEGIARDNEYSFNLIAATQNQSDIIERNRKRMYNSYAALIVSLPLYFISYGQYLNEYNSWASGRSSGQNLNAWDTARNVTMGISIGLGINFLTQLGIYIYSANNVLPEEVIIE